MIRFLTTLILASMPLVQTIPVTPPFESNITDFAFDLFATDPFENAAISPLGVHNLFSMIYPGAKDSTADELSKVLWLPDLQTTLESYRLLLVELSRSLGDRKNVEFRLANKAFIKKNLHVWIGYKLKIKKYFNASIESLDFEKNEVAAKTINNWVKKNTKNKIKRLVSSDDFDESTRIVLVNAIYFKGKWLQQFNRHYTQDELFFPTTTKSVYVKMMRNVDYFYYKFDEYLNAQVLELPTTNENFTMIVILPKTISGIISLKARLEHSNLRQILSGLQNTLVDVSLPRFKIEQTTNLRNSLEDLHLWRIFDSSQANLKGIAKVEHENELYVSKAIQKAFIRVSESGIEAAAASEVIGSTTTSGEMWPTDPTIFNAEHPFIFILKALVLYEPVPLFMGSVNNPVEK